MDSFSGVKWETLDLSKNTKLKYLWAKENNLKEMDFSFNPDLIQLGLNYNQLTGINVSQSE